MNRIIESLDVTEKGQFLKLPRIDRLSIWMVSVINQNLVIILVGIALSFTVEYTLRYSEMRYSEGALRFVLYGLTTLFWILGSFIQVLHTVKFIILQNDLPIVNVKDRVVNINGAINYLLSTRLSDIRKLSILFVLMFFLFLMVFLLIAIQFLEINQWISVTGIWGGIVNAFLRFSKLLD